MASNTRRYFERFSDELYRNISSSEPDPSSSDLSTDTVIYVGHAEEATDGEHPPVYIPSLTTGDASSSDKVDYINQPNTPDVSSNSDKKSFRSSPCRSRHSYKTVHTAIQKNSPSKSLSHKSKGMDLAKYCIYDNSDEQWIDGPRISKARLAEVRHFMKESCRLKRIETWVDGPGKNKLHESYGYMDCHKKRMIKKWINNQAVEMRNNANFKLSDFNTVHKEKYHEKRQCAGGLDSEDYTDIGAKKVCKKNSEGGEDTGLTIPTFFESLSDRELSIENLNMLLRDKLQATINYSNSFKTDESLPEPNDTLEVVEVEEPLHPVPTRDYCVQVSEDDIAFHMNSNLNEETQQFPNLTYRIEITSTQRSYSHNNLNSLNDISNTHSLYNCNEDEGVKRSTSQESKIDVSAEGKVDKSTGPEKENDCTVIKECHFSTSNPDLSKPQLSFRNSRIQCYSMNYTEEYFKNLHIPDGSLDYDKKLPMGVSDFEINDLCHLMSGSETLLPRRFNFQNNFTDPFRQKTDDGQPCTSYGEYKFRNRPDSGYNSIDFKCDRPINERNFPKCWRNGPSCKGKCGSKQDKSLCMWLLNPFTCKYYISETTF